MKKILIITERRADFSRFKPIIKLIQKDKKLDYNLIVTGLHLVKEHGFTINEIKKEKFKIFSKFKMFDKNYFKKMMELKWLEQLVSFLKISQR